MNTLIYYSETLKTIIILPVKGNALKIEQFSISFNPVNELRNEILKPSYQLIKNVEL